jgi:S-methylmethionine-dependent homocysteine/selenocysteine methylase
MKSSAVHGSNAAPGPLGRLLARVKVQNRPAILDGAMGTELDRRGVDTGLPLWSARALMESPATVRGIHDDYIEAGADIITTNTFRTTRRTFLRAGSPDRSAELTALAVTLARESIAAHRGKGVLIAGSIAPLEDCYRPDLVPSEGALRDEHTEHAVRLAEAGVDFLILETMGTVREAMAAAHAARKTGLEFIVSFLCSKEGTLYSGEPPEEAVRQVAELSPAALSLNCSSPRIMGRHLKEFRSALRDIHRGDVFPLVVYANVGIPGGERREHFYRDVDPAEYADFARSWVDEGVSIVGGCCGTTPEYIRALRGAIA